ncbi:hypothetical protein [Qipengyuania gaetbuli]|uniref:hypothetical protein n=1 Tax=Qipengyuania gaetbuli TaxID=266952 RepID=UPI001CFD6432|nr:hypothetical protein [Qipengyuania gaetbuli]
MARSSRLRQIGWLLSLGACLAVLLALTFKVNAVKSDVRLVERQIIAAERAKLMLETEFQTRASQQQLAAWNQVEFGYSAPRADQYVEQERQLAALGSPRGMDAPEPIRVAMLRPVSQGDNEESLFGDWLGEEEQPPAGARREVANGLATTLAQRLSQPGNATLAAAEVAR